MSRRIFGLSLACAISAPSLALAAPDVLRNVKYGPAIRQSLDVYLPDNPQGAPIMVMVHGGGWAIGNKSNKGSWKEKQRHWGARGYIFISVNYRMVPFADPLEQARDVARAIAYVQAHAGEYGGDSNQMVVMGHSAGAHLVSLLAVDPDFAAENGAKPWRATISLDTAAYDVEEIMTSSPGRLYRNAFGDDPALWRATSPIARLKRTNGPFLLVCSSQRGNACPAAEKFAAALAKIGGQSQIMSINKAHSAINKDLGKPGAYTGAVDDFLHTIGLP
ncbi:MAG: alpha/beta hydrolase [Rhodobacteraceae bacterium]|nr:alpha/beta hydrolase [Paracoccaceae bacterium]